MNLLEMIQESFNNVDATSSITSDFSVIESNSFPAVVTKVLIAPFVLLLHLWQCVSVPVALNYKMSARDGEISSVRTKRELLFEWYASVPERLFHYLFTMAIGFANPNGSASSRAGLSPACQTRSHGFNFAANFTGNCCPPFKTFVHTRWRAKAMIFNVCGYERLSAMLAFVFSKSRVAAQMAADCFSDFVSVYSRCAFGRAIDFLRSWTSQKLSRTKRTYSCCLLEQTTGLPLIPAGARACFEYLGSPGFDQNQFAAGCALLFNQLSNTVSAAFWSTHLSYIDMIVNV